MLREKCHQKYINVLQHLKPYIILKNILHPGRYGLMHMSIVAMLSLNNFHCNMWWYAISCNYCTNKQIFYAEQALGIFCYFFSWDFLSVTFSMWLVSLIPCRSAHCFGTTRKDVNAFLSHAFWLQVSTIQYIVLGPISEFNFAC